MVVTGEREEEEGLQRRDETGEVSLAEAVG